MKRPFNLFEAKIDEKTINNWVYHYTKPKTLIEDIILNRTLKMNTFKELNDPKESKFGATYITPKEIDEEEISSIQKKVEDFFNYRLKVICFSKDDRRILTSSYPDFVRFRGYTKLNMWAHYADNHKGACLIFDSSKIQKAINSIKKTKDIVFEDDMNYERILTDESTTQILRINQPGAYVFNLKELRKNFEKNIIKNICKYKATYFFYKYSEWGNENEYRWVLLNNFKNPEYFEFKDALIGIVVGMDMDELSIKKTIEFANKMGINVTQVDFRSNRSFGEKILN